MTVHIDTSQIPPAEVKNLSQTFLAAVKRYYSDPENLKQFEELQKNKEKK